MEEPKPMTDAELAEHAEELCDEVASDFGTSRRGTTYKRAWSSQEDASRLRPILEKKMKERIHSDVKWNGEFSRGLGLSVDIQPVSGEAFLELLVTVIRTPEGTEDVP